MAASGKQQTKPTRKKKGGESQNGSAEASSTARHDLVVQAIVDVAASIFADRGIDGASMRDIAGALGMSRPAIYHYFPSKVALLERVLEDYSGPVVVSFKEIRSNATLGPSEKLRGMVRTLALQVAAKHDHVRLLAQSERRLPPEFAAEVSRGRSRATGHVTDVISEGIESGEFRSTDPAIAAKAAFGMCHWVAWWYSPEGRVPIDEVADLMADVVVRGLIQPGDRKGEAGIRHAAMLLREDLEYLERVAGTNGA